AAGVRFFPPRIRNHRCPDKPAGLHRWTDHFQTPVLVVYVVKGRVKSAESPAFLLSPDIAGRFAHGTKQGGIIAGLAEPQISNPCQTVKIKKRSILTVFRRTAKGRDHTDHKAAHGKRAEIAQHADPLMTFHHIVVSSVFVSLDGIVDTLQKMGLT